MTLIQTHSIESAPSHPSEVTFDNPESIDQPGNYLDQILGAIDFTEPNEQAVLHYSISTILDRTDSKEEDSDEEAERKNTQRETIFKLMSEGLSYGGIVMDKLSVPLGEMMAGAQHTYGDASEFGAAIQDASAFKDQMRTTFANSFLRALPTIAAAFDGPILETIHLADSHHERSFGYEIEPLESSLYALGVTVEALKRISRTGSATNEIVVNPFGKGSSLYSLEDLPPIDEKEYAKPENVKYAKPVRVYTREETENERILDEYGKGSNVQASISYRVPLDEIDRRKSKSVPRVRTNEQKYVGETDQEFTIRRAKEEHAKNSVSEVSIRIDFEGDIRHGLRGVSLDLGSILGDENGLSVVVGTLFSIGSILISKKNSQDPTLNHNPNRIDQHRFGNDYAFMLIARAFKKSIENENTIHENPYSGREDASVNN